jgi:hypothetical protein
MLCESSEPAGSLLDWEYTWKEQEERNEHVRPVLQMHVRYGQITVEGRKVATGNLYQQYGNDQAEWIGNGRG